MNDILEMFNSLMGWTLVKAEEAKDELNGHEPFALIFEKDNEKVRLVIDGNCYSTISVELTSANP